MNAKLAPLIAPNIDKFLSQALSEDLGSGDIYTRLCRHLEIDAESFIVIKENGVLSGRMYVERLCEIWGVRVKFFYADGEEFLANAIVAELQGNLFLLLALERVILNLLAHSSGIATLTKKFVVAMGDSPCSLLDTRKTRPLLREFEKYSVRNGGGRNHRFNLSECLMLKDTHLAKIKDLKSFLQDARNHLPFGSKLEVECETLAQVELALDSGVDIVMCDNMSIELAREAVLLRDKLAPNVLIEVSGGITLENIKEYAKIGANAISCGAIIHHATWLDVSMKMRD